MTIVWDIGTGRSPARTLLICTGIGRLMGTWAGLILTGPLILGNQIKGAVRINPAQVPIRRPIPVHIERVLAGDRPVPMSQTIVIPPGRGKLEIDFTACNLVAPQRESFRYKLEGFDETWTSTSRTRAAYYTNLPPGRYRFRVVASDGGSPVNASEASISLVWRPAFYQT